MVDIEKVIASSYELTLLYVEDNENSRASDLVNFVEFFKTIIVAVDGDDGLQKFKDNRVDIVITDINTPGLNGLEFIQNIRQIDKEVSILVLSTHDESSYFIESIRLGVDGYLLKPIETEQFLFALDKVVDKISSKRENEKNIGLVNQYQEIVDKSAVVSKTDLMGIITYANDEFCKLSGYTKEELVGSNHNIIRHPENPKEIYRQLWETISVKKEIWHGVLKNISKSGKTYYVNSTIKPLLNQHGEILEYIALRYDITDVMLANSNLETNLSKSQDMLFKMRHVDSITGLQNQNALISFFKSSKSEIHTVVGIKVDNLKNIKDILGNEFADNYLCELTQLLAKYTEHIDGFSGLYRVYFDEMVLVLDGKSDNYIKIAYELSTIVKSFFTSKNDITISSTSTIAMFGGKEDMYVKTISVLLFTFENYRGEVYIVNDDSKCFEDEFPNNIYWLSRYSKAIENEKMVPFYQPILNNATGTVDKFECLARIFSNNEVVSPDKFVNLALGAKQISFLTKTIVRKAFEHFADKPQFEFSINLSASDLQDDELYKYVLYWQNKTNIDPARCIIEILESEDIYKYKILRRTIENFKSAGFKIAIDDFGTGYSNFITLYEYNVDFIKIDGSFIKSLDSNPDMYELVSHLAQLIKMCGAKSVAEFVSNEQILRIVQELGIDYSQGYFIGAPKPDTTSFE